MKKNNIIIKIENSIKNYNVSYWLKLMDKFTSP